MSHPPYLECMLCATDILPTEVVDIIVKYLSMKDMDTHYILPMLGLYVHLPPSEYDNLWSFHPALKVYKDGRQPPTWFVHNLVISLEDGEIQILHGSMRGKKKKNDSHSELTCCCRICHTWILY